MKKQGLAGSILSYATPCKGKLIISVICALLSVAGGIIPYGCRLPYYLPVF